MFVICRLQKIIIWRWESKPWEIICRQTQALMTWESNHRIVLHTATPPGWVLPDRVVNEAVVQKREVIVKGRGPTAGLQGRVFVRKLPLLNEVKEDLVIVGLRLPAGPRTVPEYHFLAGAVAEAEARHVQVDLFESAALSSPATSSSPLPAHVLSSEFSCFLFATLLLLSLAPVSSPEVQVFSRGGKRGEGGGRRLCRRGGATRSTDRCFDELHYFFIVWEAPL